MSRLEMVSEIAALDAESAGILAGIGGDVMNKHWKRMKLIDVIQKTETINPQKNPDASFEYIDVSSICNKQFRIKETSTILGKDAPSRARKFVRTGDILFATVRPTLKRIAQVPEYLDSQVCSTGYFVLRPKDFVEARFLFYFLFTKHFMGAMEQLQKGASYPAVNDSEVSCQTISIPPLSEQKRIVSIVDEAFEAIDIAIDNTKQNLTNARELFESYLNAIFTQKGDGWEEKKLEDVCESIIDCINKTASVIEEPSPFKMIRTTNVRNGCVNIDSVRYVTEETYRQWTRRQTPKKGDVLLTREAPMGEVGMILTDDRVFLGQRIVSYRTDSNKLDNNFLLYALQSSDLQNQIKAFASGSTVQHMRVPDTKILRISIPSLLTQRQVVQKINCLRTQSQRLEAIYRQKLTALNELKQSILHKAFTGELTADTADLMTNIEQEAIAV
jgi:type I restriction enzyme, S subunit